ncbi:MAG: hypothetical protein C4523_19125 [Myxococcales bacterium]|nr:MAG: hypothetical protein C4523_19125 [Myxococcales bacterium]
MPRKIPLCILVLAALIATFSIALAACSNKTEDGGNSPGDVDPGEIDFGHPDADVDYDLPPVDGDASEDGDDDLSEDGELADGESDGGEEGESWDFEPAGEFEWEFPEADQDPTDIGEQEPNEKVLPFDGRQTVETSPFGVWEYTLAVNDAQASEAQAALKSGFGGGETVTAVAPGGITGNPPQESSIANAGDTLAWSAYRAFNADGSVPSDPVIVLRRERQLTFQVEIRYWSATAPEQTNAEFKQAAIVPNQPTAGENEAIVAVVHLWELAEDDAFLYFRVYRALIDGDSVSLVAQGEGANVRLLGGHRDDIPIRIFAGGDYLWLNAGDSLHRFTPLGVLVASYPILYGIENVARNDVLDFALSPDAASVSILGEVAFEDESTETVWSLHPTSLVSGFIKQFRFGYAYPNYRTIFSPDSRYAFVVNGDPNVYDDAYFADIEAETVIVNAVNQPFWGRPLTAADPDRFQIAYPVSTDGFKSIGLRFAEREIADLVAAGAPAE